MANTDLLHACRYCGYHEDIGWHGEVTPGDSPSVRMVRCIVPAGAKQLVSISGYSMTVIGNGESPADAPLNTLNISHDAARR